MADRYLPVWGHLEELRRRIFKCLSVWLVASAAMYAFKDPVFDFLVRPVGELYFLTPTGAFMLYVKLACLGGVLVSAPYVIWQGWAFISPALRESETRVFFRYGGLSLVLFVLGVFCGWGLVSPSVHYLIGFQNARLKPMITVDEYSSFVFMLLLCGGLTFEMPIVMLGLSRMGVVSSHWLWEQWRIAVVASVLLAGVLTPTGDMVTQAVVAAPMILLYFVSMALVKFGERKRARAMTMGLSRP